VPYEFNPDAAILYAAAPDINIDEGAFALQEEDFLLTHRCRRTAQCQTERVLGQKASRSGLGSSVNPDVECLLRVDFDQTLEFQIEATALALQGLADHHPGAGLDDYALAFLNGAGPLPFRFLDGTWIYMDPSQDCAAGDLAEISFRVVREFTELTAEVEPPPDFVVLPEQTVAALTSECLNELLKAAFLNSHGLGAAGAAPLTLTLYSGNPATTGTAISAPLALTLWENVDEPNTSVPASTRVRNSSMLEFPFSGTGDRILTHLLWARNGVPIARKELAAPLSIPVFFRLEIPVNALALQLTWPQAGDMAISWTERPARYAFRFLFGYEDFEPSQPETFVNGYFGDPHTGGVPVGGNTSPMIVRSALGWTVSGNNAVSAAAVTGDLELAPAGGWYVSAFVVGVDGGMAWVIVKAFDPPIYFPEGSPIYLDPGALDVTVSSP
jgi:hypothetical protein